MIFRFLDYFIDFEFIVFDIFDSNFFKDSDIRLHHPKGLRCIVSAYLLKKSIWFKNAWNLIGRNFWYHVRTESCGIIWFITIWHLIFCLSIHWFMFDSKQRRAKTWLIRGFVNLESWTLSKRDGSQSSLCISGVTYLCCFSMSR